MPRRQKKRVTASAIEVDTNLRCMRIYPVADKATQGKTLADLKTVAIKLSPDQAIHLNGRARLRSGPLGQGAAAVLKYLPVSFAEVVTDRPHQGRHGAACMVARDVGV